MQRLRRTIEWLVAGAEEKCAYDKKQSSYFTFKLNFITLTLPIASNDIPDEVLKRQALKHFLDHARYMWDLKSYVWKAETQLNGNLHFHLTTDTYIPYDSLRKAWNHELDKLGLIDRYQWAQQEFHKEGFRARPELFKQWPLAKQLAAYEYGVKTNWRNPNSTDVHAVKSIKKLAGYLVKYMVKNEKDRRLINGKVWGCSSNLSHKYKVSICEHDHTAERIKQAFRDLHKEIWSNEHCDYLQLTDSDFNKYVTGEVREQYNAILHKIRSYSPELNRRARRKQ